MTDWDNFNSNSYVNNHYLEAQAFDIWLLKRLQQELKALSNTAASPLRGVDIGAGPSLIPALSAIGSLDSLDLIDPSHQNIEYLKQQIDEIQEPWISWAKLINLDKKEILQKSLSKLVNIKKGGFETLPENHYSTIMSICCIESISSSLDDFSNACKKLAASLEPGGLLLAALVLGSSGYSIEDYNFPAVSLSLDSAEELLSRSFQIKSIELIPGSEQMRPDCKGIGFVAAKALG